MICCWLSPKWKCQLGLHCVVNNIEVAWKKNTKVPRHVIRLVNHVLLDVIRTYTHLHTGLECWVRLMLVCMRHLGMGLYQCFLNSYGKYSTLFLTYYFSLLLKRNSCYSTYDVVKGFSKILKFYTENQTNQLTRTFASQREKHKYFYG